MKIIDDKLAELERTVKPYRDDHPSYTRLPEVGRNRADILSEMQSFYDREGPRWRDGLVSGAVYHGDQEHIDFQNQVYALNSQSNPLHFDTWPSSTKFEAEIVSMTAQMLGADQTRDEIVGTVPSGGTESILLAMKSYRDRARERKKIRRPEIIVPVTAHAAFDKAAQYFNLSLKRVPVDKDFKADLKAVGSAITKDTIAIAGSAPSFPHGVIDPIQEMSELARQKGIGFHTDACLGGFLLPWAEKLGYPVAPFDFRLPGVTSMSADTHKYGYAAKGTSVVLYRGQELRRWQYFATAEWPGGLYFSPTLAGSRPGALSAACWAAMLSLGEQGYLEAARRILEIAVTIKQGIASIPELYILGDPLWVIAFASHELDIYAVMDAMGRKGWILNGLQRPPAIHIALTLRHCQPGLSQRFIHDLKEAVSYVKSRPRDKGSLTPIYGMANNFALKGAARDVLKRVVDILFKV